MTRALEVLAELTALRGTALPLREVQTLAMALSIQRTLDRSSVLTLLDSPAYPGYAKRRRGEAVGA